MPQDPTKIVTMSFNNEETRETQFCYICKLLQKTGTAQ